MILTDDVDLVREAMQHKKALIVNRSNFTMICYVIHSSIFKQGVNVIRTKHLTFNLKKLFLLSGKLVHKKKKGTTDAFFFFTIERIFQARTSFPEITLHYNRIMFRLIRSSLLIYPYILNQEVSITTPPPRPIF